LPNLAEFTIRPVPASPFAEMGVITVLAPDNPANHQALGYDMYSERVRRAAMDTAISTGRAAGSGKVQLIQDLANQPTPGFLIYVPVFERLGEGRQWSKGPLKGFVYSPIRANEFLSAALRRVPHKNINVQIYDGPAGANSLLAASLSEGEPGTPMTRTVLIGDRTWTLTVTSVEGQLLSPVSRLSLLFGVLVSLLVLALSWFATSRAAEDRKVLEWLTRQSAIRLSLTRELNHRVKNTLANVLSIVSLTRRRSDNIDDFAESLTGRIRALSATHDLLSQRDWNDAPLREVATSELAPYLDPDDPHAELDGPDISLSPNDALSLGLALHELATNAAKYGALSNASGHVSIKWRLLSDTVAEVDWQESGGPPVQEPSRRGFGLDLIEKVVSHELKATVELNFAETGVHCRLKVPVRDPRAFAIREGHPE
jgi:two-component sensor histidine kinase